MANNGSGCGRIPCVCAVRCTWQQPAKKGRFFKAPSPQALAAAARTARYEGRRNTCPTCFTARSATGACGCTE